MGAGFPHDPSGPKTLHDSRDYRETAECTQEALYDLVVKPLETFAALAASKMPNGPEYMDMSANGMFKVLGTIAQKVRNATNL